MSLVKDFFTALGNLRFGRCMEILSKLRPQSPKLKKWLGHIVMCEKDYYRARFGTDKNDSLQKRYSFLQSRVYELTKNAPFENQGSNENVKLRMSILVKYRDQYGVVITRQLWTALLNFVNTRERLCTLYEMIAKSKPPHHYDYFCLETVEIQKNSKILHHQLERIQENLSSELGVLFKSFRCESYIDKLRYTECLYAFWSVRETLNAWRDRHRKSAKNSGKSSPKNQNTKQPQFILSSPSRFINTRKKDKSSPGPPPVSASFRRPPSSSMGGDVTKTMSFRVRAQESISSIRKLLRFGVSNSRKDDKQNIMSSSNSPFKTPPKNQASKSLLPRPKKTKDSPISKPRPSSTDPTNKRKKSPEQQQQSPSPPPKTTATTESKSILETYDLYKWMRILHGYTFSKFTFFFHDILSFTYQRSSKEFDKISSDVGINYVERIKHFCRDQQSGIDHVFLLYKGKRNYGTLTLDPRKGYSLDLNLDLHGEVENTFQGIKSYPCLFFHNFSIEREKILKDHMVGGGENNNNNNQQDEKSLENKDSSSSPINKNDDFEEEENGKEEEEEEEGKSSSRFEIVGKSGKSAVIRAHWANILNLIWTDEVKMDQERKPLFFLDSRAGIGYYYMKVGEDIFFVFVNRESERTKQTKRKRVFDFMVNLNSYLQNMKLFEFLRARAPDG